MPNRRANTLPLLLAPLLLASACGGGGDASGASSTGATTAEPSHFSGRVVLRPHPSIIGVGGLYIVGGDCDGDAATRTGYRYFEGGFASFKAGATVSVADASGKVVGVASLGSGTWQTKPTQTNLLDHECIMAWSVDAEQSNFYSVTIAGRTPAVYPLAAMTDGADLVLDSSGT